MGVGNRWVFRRGAFILITVKSSTKLIAELFVRAFSERSGAPCVKKFGNLCIQEILALRKAPLCMSTFHVSWGEILHLKYQHVLAVNCIATETFSDKKQPQSQFFSFDLILMSTLTCISEKELEPEIKKPSRSISFEE